MGADLSTSAATGTQCPSFPADLSFLLHAATNRITVDLDNAARDMGLNDMRDWLVLAALDAGRQLTQLELSRMVCVDKTTLIGVLDRLEQRELIVRTVDPADRRVRIPQITDPGRRVHDELAAACRAVEAHALGGVAPEDRERLLDALQQIANRDAGVAELASESRQ